MTRNIRDQLQATLGDAYIIERELSGGGMSRVFVAEEVRLKRKVVVKVLSPELSQGLSGERFEREIQTAAALQQAHIVPVLTAGETEGLPFYTMPYVEGESLRVRLGRGPLAVSEIISVLRDVSKALAYAHRHGVVHRDIKPDNVLLSEGSAVVTDFGIAKAISAARTDSVHATLTQIGTSIGTPAYMAPEQAAGDPNVDHRADIYSLGAMAYELITGQAVFAGRTPQRMLAAHMGEEPAPVTQLRADVPQPLADLVMRCLAKDPDARPQSGGDISRVLDSITSGSGMQAMPPVLLGGPGMFRKALAIYAGAFVVVALVAKAAIVGIGLPDWVFPGSLIVMALGLPVILWTAYVQRVVKRSVTTTPTFTPGGTPSTAAHGTMATMALKAAPHVSWYRTARGGIYALAAFIAIISGFMTLRALGIGPVGSLLASGELERSDKVLLPDFSVSGGGADSTLGRVVSDAVGAGLSQARTFTLVSPAELADALRRMQRPASSRIDFALARQLAEREGFKAILDGNVTMVGSAYIVAVRLVRADSGRELTSQRASAASPDKLIEASDEIARKLLSKAGESLRRVQSAPPLAQMTTGSLEALRKYGEASRLNEMERNPLAAVAKLREVVAIDSNFAEAWRKMSAAMAGAGLPRSQGDSAIARAFALRHRAGDVERQRIEAYYYSRIPARDRGRSIAAYQTLLDRGETTLVLNNIGVEYNTRREFARAEAAHRANLKQFPNLRIGLVNLLVALRNQGKWRDYDSVVTVAQKAYPQDQEWRWLALERLWQKGEIDAFDRGVDSASKGPVDARDPSRPLRWKSSIAGLRGQTRQALVALRESRRVDSTVGRRLSPVLDAVSSVGPRADLNLPVTAELQELEAVLARHPIERMPLTERPYFPVARAFAAGGRPDRAKAVLESYRAAADTGFRRAQAPLEHDALMVIAIAEQRWTDAAREARLADQMPDGPANSCSECLPRNLARIYSRAGMPDSAIAAYEEFRKTPWGGRPWKGQDISMGGLTLELLSRSFLARGAPGDTAKAAEMLGQLVERWKNADPELQPRVSAARDQLRRMQLDRAR